MSHIERMYWLSVFARAIHALAGWGDENGALEKAERLADAALERARVRGMLV